jgi:DNA-binding beta-propeller fold protein YncE
VSVLLAGLALAVTAAALAADQPGTVLWTAIYHGSGHRFDIAYSTAVSPDGTRVYVTGKTEGTTTGDDYATLAYDAATGARVWAVRYNGPGNGIDQAYALALSPDGSRVFVTGTSAGADGTGDWATVAYEAATGSRLWVRRYRGAVRGYDAANGLAVSPDGAHVYVTGRSVDARGDEEATTIAYDTPNGDPDWVRHYDAWAGADWGADVAVTGDGSRVFVVGSGGGRNSLDVLTLAYSSTGDRLWARRFGGADSFADYGVGLAVAPDGAHVYVLGQVTEALGELAYRTVAYDVDGRMEWSRRLGRPGTAAGAYGIAVSPDGTSVYVTGDVPGTGGLDYGTVAYAAAGGTVRWFARYDSPAHGADSAYAVQSSPDGSRLYVTGNTATVAYGADGRQLWAQPFPSASAAPYSESGLALSPDGSRVFVCGWYFESGAVTDYYTVAYAS